MRVAAAAKITVCNIGQAPLDDVQLNDPDINDNADLLPASTSLPGGSIQTNCAQVAANRRLTITVPYDPGGLPTNAMGTCRFDNTVTATATAGFLAKELGNCVVIGDDIVCTDAAMAQCDLCPLPTDTDEDTIPDSVDNCPNEANADQADSNLNGVGDVCES